jgi:hypothetical protein
MLLFVGVMGGTMVPQRHNGTLNSPISFPLKGKFSIHYVTIEGDHRTHTSLEQSTKLNWRPQINHHKGQKFGAISTTYTNCSLQSNPMWDLHHNDWYMWYHQDTKSSRYKTSGYKNSRVIGFSLPVSRKFVENSNRRTKCNGKNRSDQVLDTSPTYR